MEKWESVVGACGIEGFELERNRTSVYEKDIEKLTKEKYKDDREKSDTIATGLITVSASLTDIVKVDGLYKSRRLSLLRDRIITIAQAMRTAYRDAIKKYLEKNPEFDIKEPTIANYPGYGECEIFMQHFPIVKHRLGIDLKNIELRVTRKDFANQPAIYVTLATDAADNYIAIAEKAKEHDLIVKKLYIMANERQLFIQHLYMDVDHAIQSLNMLIRYGLDRDAVN